MDLLAKGMSCSEKKKKEKKKKRYGVYQSILLFEMREKEILSKVSMMQPTFSEPPRDQWYNVGL